MVKSFSCSYGAQNPLILQLLPGGGASGLLINLDTVSRETMNIGRNNPASESVVTTAPSRTRWFDLYGEKVKSMRHFMGSAALALYSTTETTPRTDVRSDADIAA